VPGSAVGRAAYTLTAREPNGVWSINALCRAGRTLGRFTPVSSDLAANASVRLPCAQVEIYTPGGMLEESYSTSKGLLHGHRDAD
jgi:hypothetical protein